MFGVNASMAHASITVPSTTYTSMAQFEAAVGGANNGTVAGEQGGGFRDWTPAGIAVDGSDPGSTAIPGGHTAALSPNRLQPWGIELGPDVAVANDGFKSVNSNAGFTPLDLWAPFNSNTTTFQVVDPDSPTPSVTRGLGIVFVNAENAGATIEYYSGNMLLGQVSPSATSFAGMLFAQPVVTRVVITFGADPIFGFDGSTLTPGTTASNTLAAGDDVVLAEPGAGESTAPATAGAPVSPTFASFESDEPAADIRATVNWGDGTAGSGTIVPAGGGVFQVAGSHSYAQPGSYTATVTVDDFSGSEFETQAQITVAPRATTTNVSCSPASVAVSATTVCSAIVSDVDSGSPTAPTGLVTFSSPTAGAAFPAAASCVLGAISVPGTSMCEVQFEPQQLPPVQARISAGYGGDEVHAASQASTTIAVHEQHCSISSLSKRLRAGGFGVLVTCEARSNVKIAAEARAARRGPSRAFQLSFGSVQSAVTPGRPTVLVIRPARGVLATLRAALARHQRVSMRLTLTASSHATRTTTTRRVSAISAP
ncbi:MAG TPA: hypothetical protein VMF57_08130 [Solirubrobacteraceae bacterium]|nr:hypothetical protein [Solirubrobacteraceae bacterium]